MEKVVAISHLHISDCVLPGIILGPMDNISNFLGLLTLALQKAEGFRAKMPRVKLKLFYRNPLKTQGMRLSGFTGG